MKRRRLLLIVPLALLGGCSPLQTQINDSSLRFAEEVGGSYLTYVDADPLLTDTQKSLRHDRVEAQKNMLMEALGNDN